MEIGVFTFADVREGESAADRLREVVEEAELADEVGLDVFGVGEHHRPEFAVSAPAMVLAAVAARTKRIRLTSAVTVLSSAVPVRAVSAVRDARSPVAAAAQRSMAGRGSFIESFPLFGFDLRDYDPLFEEKLLELLRIRETGESLAGHGVYPRPDEPIPIWVAVGGTPESAVRAGMLGLPMALAIIGGLPERFRPFADLHRRAAEEAGLEPPSLSINSHGYIAETRAAGARRVVPVRRGGDEQDRPRARLAADDPRRVRRCRTASGRELRRNSRARWSRRSSTSTSSSGTTAFSAAQRRRHTARGHPPLDRAARREVVAAVREKARAPRRLASGHNETSVARSSTHSTRPAPPRRGRRGAPPTPLFGGVDAQELTAADLESYGEAAWWSGKLDEAIAPARARVCRRTPPPATRSAPPGWR